MLACHEILSCLFDALLVLFSIGLYRHLISFLKSGSLLLKTIPLILIFGPERFFFRSLIEGQPIKGCIENSVNRPLNHIFLILKRCSAAKIHYYSSVSWFLLPMTGDIAFAAHICVNVKKIQSLFHINFF